MLESHIRFFFLFFGKIQEKKPRKLPILGGGVGGGAGLKHFIRSQKIAFINPQIHKPFGLEL